MPPGLAWENNMDREIEFLRHQCEYLERMLQNCMSHITSLEARVAELERRPVAIAIPEDQTGSYAGARREETEVLLAHGITFWEGVRGPRR